MCNYFLWRQKDATRNSIEAVGHAYFSSNELHKKNCNEIQDMLFTIKEINWNDFSTTKKRGSCIVKTLTTFANEKGVFQRGKWVIDSEIPIFSQAREYIERFI